VAKEVAARLDRAAEELAVAEAEIARRERVFREGATIPGDR